MSNDSHSMKSNSASADTVADAIEFAEGSIFKSKYEFYRLQRNERFKTDPIYRAQAEAKLERTYQAYGPGCFGESARVVDQHGDAMAAVAWKNPETGEYEGRAIHWSEQGATRGSTETLDKRDKQKPRDDSNGKYGENVRTENLPGGGTLRVSVKGLPLIDQSAAEKRAREAYVKRAKEHQEQWTLKPITPKPRGGDGEE